MNRTRNPVRHFKHKCLDGLLHGIWPVLGLAVDPRVVAEVGAMDETLVHVEHNCQLVPPCSGRRRLRCSKKRRSTGADTQPRRGPSTASKILPAQHTPAQRCDRTSSHPASEVVILECNYELRLLRVKIGAATSEVWLGVDDPRWGCEPEARLRLIDSYFGQEALEGEAIELDTVPATVEEQVAVSHSQSQEAADSAAAVQKTPVETDVPANVQDAVVP